MDNAPPQGEPQVQTALLGCDYGIPSPDAFHYLLASTDQPLPKPPKLDNLGSLEYSLGLVQEGHQKSSRKLALPTQEIDTENNSVVDIVIMPEKRLIFTTDVDSRCCHSV